MNKKLLKLPALSLIGGIILYVLTFIIILLGFGITWGPKVSIVLYYLPTLLNIVIIIILGIILRRTYDRKDFFRSATLLVIYTIIISILQRIALYLGIYNFTIDWIFSLPISLFRILVPLSVKYDNFKIISSLIMIVSIFEPYIMILFGKNIKN